MTIPKGVMILLITLLLAASLVSPAGADLLINEIMAANVGGIVDEDGDNEDWIEILNTGPEDIDLGGYHLSDDPGLPLLWSFPSRLLPAGERLLLFASAKNRLGDELHTNFCLNAQGDPILLLDPEGLLVDILAPTFLPVGISCGRYPDGGQQGLYFDIPTPDAINDSPAYSGFAPLPQVDLPGGLFAGGVTVTIANPGSLDTLTTWTLEGWEPQADGVLYSEPINLTETSVLRVRRFEPGKLPSGIVTHSYLIGETPTLPVVSVVTHPDHLWDEETGIYVFGTDYSPQFPYYGANFWESWERAASLEYFLPDGTPAFSLDLGIKIHGNMSRALDQKSLRLVMRGGYGMDAIDYPIFPGYDVAHFERLILRNASNDWCQAHMRDGFAQDALSDGLDLDRQAYQPTLVFLNGEYWGIHNMRERQDQRYLASHHGVDPDSVDILQREGYGDDVVAGDNVAYQELVDFLEANNLSDLANYTWVQNRVEVENVATYWLVEIFSGNIDWPRNNRYYWRPRTPDGRWRFLLNDLDYTLGIDDGPEFDSMDYATHPTGSSDQNEPWATLIIRRLLENDGFRQDFIARYQDMLNSIMSAPVLEQRLDEATAVLLPEIERHMLRWGHTLLRWTNRVETLREYLEVRTDYAREHLRLKFALGDTLTLSLDIEPPGAGRIALTTIEIDSAWSGLYLAGSPLPLRAHAAPGYEFQGWSDPELPQESEILIDPTEAMSLRAIFVEAGALPELVINEINYNSAPDFDTGDWVELHNPTQTALDASGWIFKDADDLHAFELPPGTIIGPEGFLVLCDNPSAFDAYFPDAQDRLGPLGFGFSGGGELLRIFDNQGVLADSVLFDDLPPWPVEPDGGGPSLELIHPEHDNAQGGNWAASQAPALHGTPGEPNSIYSATAVPETIQAGLRLAHPWPNPFNPSTRIAFSLPAAGPAGLTIHDAGGRRVRTLLAGETLVAGHHELSWNGRDDSGSQLASGIYFVRLSSNSHALSHKLVLLK